MEFHILLALDVICLDQKYFEFFDDIPKHAKLTIQALVPEKISELNTYTLACVFYQHSMLKSIVKDNLKECAEKIANQVLKRTKDTESLCDLDNLPLSESCKWLIDNYINFKHRYSSKATSDVLTTYMSYMMIIDQSLESYKFFEDCLYVKERDRVIGELYVKLVQELGIDRSQLLPEFGEYLTNPFVCTKYQCFGREEEIAKCINILCRKDKSNVIIVGQPGVGKTSIVYGICNYIQSEKCPECLRNHEVFSLNLTKLVSGTTYRGDLEARLDEVIAELKQYKNTIVFIDELQAIFSRTSSDSSGNEMQNALKPFLVSDSKVIGCTTDSGYKAIESDNAFERRFTVVPVKEPDIKDCYDILENARQNYEKFHNISIPKELVLKSVDLCNLYVKNRYFPDKAFDCLDTACSTCKMNGKQEVSEEDIETSALELAGIVNNKFTVSKISEEEHNIKQVILCQDQAIETVFKCLKRYSIGVNDKRKPIGSFLFVGPTGTGKTELCKQIASRFFRNDSFIRFDMSEFMEPHSISKLIGSPPGYVGFNQKGLLTEKVKHSPFSIILFDEIEKAHRDVINVLLQMMDDGRLTDAYGTTVNFCNCIIVMTSNIGCKEFLDKNSIGFGTTDNSDILTKAVNNYFSPEFRNRLDSVVYFNPISKDMFVDIFRNEINAFIDRYAEIGITVELCNETYNDTMDKCFDPKNGVRFAQRKICQLLEDKILDEIVKGSKYVKL